MERVAKIGLIVVVLASIGILIFVGPCTPAAPPTQSTVNPPAARSTVRVFTMQELAQYNGQNGQPAYVAADGTVYDVTSSPLWAGGNHGQCPISSTAGRDLTAELNQSPPSMRTLLQKFPVVGRLQ